jgi:hypothetical protein
MPRPQLASKLRDEIAEMENSIQNFAYARERMLKTRERAAALECERLDRALGLNGQSLEGLYRDLTSAKEMLARTTGR